MNDAICNSGDEGAKCVDVAGNFCKALHRGIFWKGFGNNHRTPSAWLIPNENRVTFRVSTTAAREVWGTSTVGPARYCPPRSSRSF